MLDGPFTSEQEARIAQIVEDMILGQLRHEAEARDAEAATALAWARHWSGIPPREGSGGA